MGWTVCRDEVKAEEADMTSLVCFLKEWLGEINNYIKIIDFWRVKEETKTTLWATIIIQKETRTWTRLLGLDFGKRSRLCVHFEG